MCWRLDRPARHRLLLHAAAFNALFVANNCQGIVQFGRGIGAQHWSKCAVTTQVPFRLIAIIAPTASVRFCPLYLCV